MREAYSRKVTLLMVLAELKLMRNQLPGLLLLASQRVDTLPSLDIAAVRLLPDWPDAVAVPLSARLVPPGEELDELLELEDAGPQHSLPPVDVVPKVAALQVKLPVRSFHVHVPVCPNAILVGVVPALQVAPSRHRRA